MSTLTEQPPDDAFVRTAIRGMRPPEHHPEFWDVLARQLDDAEDRMGVGVAFGPPGSLDEVPAPPRDRTRVRRPPAHRTAHPPRRAPLRAVDAPTAAVPAVTAAARPSPERQRAFVPAGTAATTVAALAGKGVRPVDPTAGLTIRHDIATLPGAMRRTSNAVLVALAVVAVAIAAIAGLSLVRRAADDGVSPPAPPPVEAGAEAAAGAAD